MRRIARIATALSVVGALVALIVPASAGAAFGPAGGWGGSGSGAGQFTSPHGVGTDSGGNVYVADKDNKRVQVFTPSGALSGAFTSSLNASFAPPINRRRPTAYWRWRWTRRRTF